MYIRSDAPDIIAKTVDKFFVVSGKNQKEGSKITEQGVTPSWNILMIIMYKSQTFTLLIKQNIPNSG